MITCPTCGAHGDQRHLRSCRSTGASLVHANERLAVALERVEAPREPTPGDVVEVSKAELKTLTRKAPDAINPNHYRSHRSGIECIQVTEHMNFNLGNAVKYIWRADDKGDPIENLRKAAWYLEREIARRQKVIPDSHRIMPELG